MNREIETKEWIRAVAHYMRLSVSAMALNAGLSPSTVTRYLNDPTNTLSVQKRTLDRIAEYSGIPVLQMPNEAGSHFITRHKDLQPYNPEDIDLPAWFHAAIAAAIKGQEDIEILIVCDNALNLSGFCLGDAVIIKKTKRPQSGDFVVGRIHFGDIENVLRVYEPPFLIAHSSSDKPQRPLTVDENLVSIAGVAIGSVRFLDGRLAFSQEKS